LVQLLYLTRVLIENLCSIAGSTASRRSGHREKDDKVKRRSASTRRSAGQEGWGRRAPWRFVQAEGPQRISSAESFLFLLLVIL
jgi:hypothetical protein